jgi:hypothetical protein
VIEQAIYGSRGAGGYQFLARSAGFRDEWVAEAERLCTGFGERPAGIACPEALFARPLDPRHVAVVQVADQGLDDAGRPGALGFRLLVLSKDFYRDLGGDLFLISDNMRPPWAARGDLPALEWTVGPPPPRTVEELRRVLNVPYSPTFLGGVQALLDGGRLMFERSEPAPDLVRSLWQLLPHHDRSDLWPATFCFSNTHGFDVVVLPRANETEVAGYIPEEQAGDYPEGRYEHSLQVAVESGNQHDLDSLLARRSRTQTFRLVVGLLVVAAVVAFFTAELSPPNPLPPSSAPPRTALVLPPVEECPRLPVPEQLALLARLGAIEQQLGIPAPLFPGGMDSQLSQSIHRLDERLGTPAPQRNPGELEKLGPIQRQLRALLWKHGVPQYDDPRLNTVELADRLRRQLEETGKLKEKQGG